MKIAKVISGGQTGVDRAALDAALELAIPIGGWCPQGRRAEDGIIPERYPLRETASAGYPVRTERNVREADETLILNSEPAVEGGTKLTCELAQRHGKGYTLINISQRGMEVVCADWLRKILQQYPEGMTLNVAGPRESSHLGVYRAAKEFLLTVLREVNDAQE